MTRSEANLPRRSQPVEWTILPAAGCRKRPPEWPDGIPDDDTARIWAHLWSLPIAAWWHEQGVSPLIVADYVRLRTAKPEHSATNRLATELALTPASASRLRLVVERAAPKAKPLADPYASIFDEMGIE